MKKLAKSAIFSGVSIGLMYGFNTIYPTKPLNDTLKVLESVGRGLRLSYFVNFFKFLTIRLYF